MQRLAGYSAGSVRNDPQDSASDVGGHALAQGMRTQMATADFAHAGVAGSPVARRQESGEC